MLKMLSLMLVALMLVGGCSGQTSKGKGPLMAYRSSTEIVIGDSPGTHSYGTNWLKNPGPADATAAQKHHNPYLAGRAARD